MSEDAHRSKDPQSSRLSSLTRRVGAPTTQDLPYHAVYTQPPKSGAFSRACAPSLLGPSSSRSEFDALHSSRPSTAVAQVQNAFDLLNLGGQSRAGMQVTGGRRVNQSSFARLPLSTMDSQFFSQPHAQYHQSHASPCLSTLPRGADQHSAALSTPSLLIPLQPGLSFPPVAHSGPLPSAFPYHHPTHPTMTSQPSLKILDHQPHQVSAAQREPATMGYPSLSPHSPSHHARPVFKQVLTSEPTRKLPHRAMSVVMWVGNLESSASLDELYTFFRQLDPIPLPPIQSAVLSIMYMPSTNCALVNMRDEAALREAVERFHGARLRPGTKSARLVCRRRGSELGSDSSLMKPPVSGMSSSPRQKATPAIEIPEGSRFFVLKSVDHVSVARPPNACEWAKFHNEPILNEALRRSPMVYLVFGVNKTGQFFGYAKMVAPIPKRNEDQEVPQLDEITAHNESISCPIANLIGRIRPTRGEKDGWGTPFPIKWICMEPLGFTRIRHIRNVWNNDREVKVSRDGQELSPDCGRMLLEEWARPRPPNATTE